MGFSVLFFYTTQDTCPQWAGPSYTSINQEKVHSFAYRPIIFNSFLKLPFPLSIMTKPPKLETKQQSPKCHSWRKTLYRKRQFRQDRNSCGSYFNHRTRQSEAGSSLSSRPAIWSSDFQACQGLVNPTPTKLLSVKVFITAKETLILPPPPPAPFCYKCTQHSCKYFIGT